MALTPKLHNKMPFFSTLLVASLVILLMSSGLVQIGHAKTMPIDIHDNDEFRDLATERGWSGIGSQTDPFVLSNFTMLADSTPAINITNTSLHFIILGASISGPNTSVGVRLYRVQNATVVASHFWGLQSGINVAQSRNITIHHSNFSENQQGIIADTVNKLEMDHNEFIKNEAGVDLFGAEVEFHHNLLEGNGVAMRNSFCESNLVYGNIFGNNSFQVHNGYCISGWNHNYSMGGNYWNNFSAEDKFSGPDQNLTGSDGIWDTPFENFWDWGQDNFALVEKPDSTGWGAKGFTDWSSATESPTGSEGQNSDPAGETEEIFSALAFSVVSAILLLVIWFRIAKRL